MNVIPRFSAIANLRVVAIVAIILNHAQIGINEDTQYSTGYFFYSQLFKFGSLLFMIISGFLFQNSVHRYQPKVLFKRKVSTILLPSLLFMAPWAVLNIFILPQLGTKTQAISWTLGGNELYNLFFRSIYWFPINLFLMFAVNNFIRNPKLLKALLIPAILITLFYCINIYGYWVPRKHNSAILGYFSFFFIGRLAYIYFPVISSYLKILKNNIRVKTAALVVLIAFFVLAVAESIFIQQQNMRTDPGNILRLSNIAYTFVLLSIAFNYRNKIKTASHFKEKSVFLIYLIHPYLLFAGKHFLPLGGLDSELHSADFIPYEMVYASLILLISLTVARLLQSSRSFNKLIAGNFKAEVKQVNV